MNIIIIDHEPYSFRKKSHYYIDEFLADGWHVQYWAVNNALDYLTGIQYTYSEEDAFVKYYFNVDAIIQSIRNFDPSDTIFIMEISFRTSTTKIYKTLYDNKYHWVRINYYLNPTEYFRGKKTLRDKLQKFSIRSLLKKIKKLPQQRVYKNPVYNVPDILFITGNKYDHVKAVKEVASLDYYDVEVYDKIKDSPAVLPYDYIVFLDVMLMNHPDIKRAGYEFTGYEKIYYEALNALFGKIEKHTGLPVVIASHPKANYNNEFGARQCIKHKTAELVIHSSSVLTHGSLSISFALFAKKPITFIYSERLFNVNYFLREFLNGVNNASERLGAEKINMDDPSSLALSKQVDDEKYDKLLEELYLKPGNSCSNFEILKQSFVRLLDK
ncbi:hypothetical protein ACFSPU_08065 [Haoranjiania flava]|uniref:Uncharacterized protein n=1 Tax=Haoranjiania flava TaxID=1856322 RepID=A0AAE3LKA4_9BACT|nr:hypothetical protein [Haoranjiania flava]MCU7694602.1 hypothetical protein [Haoranjiania flava]